MELAHGFFLVPLWLADRTLEELQFVRLPFFSPLSNGKVKLGLSLSDSVENSEVKVECSLICGVEMK